MKFRFLALPVVCALGACPSAVAAADSLAELQQKAARFNVILSLPTFETTPGEIASSLAQTLADGNAALDRLGKLSAAEVNFTNTAGALDQMSWRASLWADRVNFIKETSPNAAVRNAATDAIKKFQDWAVGLDYREDVYRALKAYAATGPKLSGAGAKLLAEIMRDYRRAGLDLPKAERDEVEALRKKLASKGTDYESNINRAAKALTFAKAQLAGVPESLLSQEGVKTGPDAYTIQAHVTWQYLAVLENCSVEATRLAVETARGNLARQENVPLLEEILTLRYEIAHRLGYRSWADYQLETKMAKTAAVAIEFEDRLVTGLQPKFDAELVAFRRLKVRQTGNENAKVELWDWRYYANELKRQKYNVDAEQLRVYFPMERVLDGMFTIYQRIFGVEFVRVRPPYAWIGDLQLFAVTDAATGEPLGFFYLDLFPREGKYNHFAVFSLIEGVRLPDGQYQRPVVSLVCNFPPPAPGKPSLLQHSDVETMFHEFGHAMHNLLTQADYARFAGANVPRDFVEAPSQMLEAWVWDKKVLDSFAADYRDPKQKIPAKVLNQLKAAKLATMGCYFRRQLAFGLMDLALHTQITPANATDAAKLSTAVLGQVFLPLPPDTASVAYFGHIIGYDAGYYGYAWAKAIAADMATKFEQAPQGFFDAGVGRRLRNEIYAVGDMRSAEESIQQFLGRERSVEPFLEEIGVRSAVAASAPPARASKRQPPVWPATPLRPTSPGE
jgi:thimet oligopeptidase